MDKWEYKEFSPSIGFTEEWLDFLNGMGSEGWELISYDERPYIFDRSKVVRKCLFKRKVR